MKLKLNNESINAEIVRVEDILSEKLCKVVMKITANEEVEGQQVKTGYEIIEGFYYEETWEDAGVIAFATEKLNKRFA